ncbi:MAG: molybdopterin-dependent oxidoreductase [Spirochaetales bacterium]|nr:molybdopterin-dependent oxidoreductase [Spirochaetales bacterium]
MNRSRKLMIAACIVATLCAATAVAQDLETWEFKVTGTATKTVTYGEIIDAMRHSVHDAEMFLDVKGVEHKYEGIPFRQIVAMVDGDDNTHPYEFDIDLWVRGYEITITAIDGYSATFDTAGVDPNALLLAVRDNGEQMTPRLVGDLPRSSWVGNIVEINLGAGDAAAAVEHELILDVNGVETVFTIPALERSAFYVEGPGSYTTSAGTTITAIWGGIRFSDFLKAYFPLSATDTVTMVAIDGYEMSYSGAEVLDDSQGIWIIAFKQNGEYLPVDPGPYRTIKIGPGTPDIPGHSSVRMIGRVKVSGEAYREFTLRLSGLMDADLDRQTMQSGVSCHKKTVQFERKNTSGLYTGIPVWRLLAYSDDPRYAPHGQDKSIRSYNDAAAAGGYRVIIIAADGFSIDLDSRQLDKNDDIIVAMYREGEVLADDEWPLVLVWDKDAELIPDGIKPVKQIVEIQVVIE